MSGTINKTKLCKCIPSLGREEFCISPRSILHPRICSNFAQHVFWCMRARVLSGAYASFRLAVSSPYHTLVMCWYGVSHVSWCTLSSAHIQRNDLWDTQYCTYCVVDKSNGFSRARARVVRVLSGRFAFLVISVPAETSLIRDPGLTHIHTHTHVQVLYTHARAHTPTSSVLHTLARAHTRAHTRSHAHAERTFEGPPTFPDSSID